MNQTLNQSNISQEDSRPYKLPTQYIKFRDPRKKQLIFETEETERLFKEYYENLSTQPTAKGECEMNLLSNREELNRELISSITKKESGAAICRLKSN